MRSRFLRPSLPRSSRSRRLCLATSFITLTTLASAQSGSSSAPAAKFSTPVPSASQTQPHLTPQQRHGYETLKEAESESAHLQPEMRAFVTWQASETYKKTKPGQSIALLKEALQTSFAIETRNTELKHCLAEVCNVKKYIQGHVLEALIDRPHKPGEIEALLASADADVRKELLPELIHDYIQRHDLKSASEALTLVTSNEDYPYVAAVDLMSALPQGSNERFAVFSQSLNNFSNQHSDVTPQFDDFAVMLFRFWRELPPASALDAIDQILKRAKQFDEDYDHRNRRASITTANQTIYFNSQYQLLLFQLEPVIEALNKPRAESLLRENQDVEDLLSRYPEGMTSIDPAAGQPSASQGHMPAIYAVGQFDSGDAGQTELHRNLQAYAAINAANLRIDKELESSPAQALSDAMNLPEQDPRGKADSPRAETLARVALALAEKDPKTSLAALAEFRKLSDGLSLYHQADVLSRLPDTYLALKDEKNARSALHELLGMAEKLYTRDTDPDDPNQAFKATWPSTALWRHRVEFSARLKPSPAEDILGAIPDPEIRTLEKVALAGSLLGEKPHFISRVAMFKNERHFETD